MVNSVVVLLGVRPAQEVVTDLGLTPSQSVNMAEWVKGEEGGLIVKCFSKTVDSGPQM